MSDNPDRRRRSLPKRLTTGSVLTSWIGLCLFVAPLILFGHSMIAVASLSASLQFELLFAIFAVMILNAVFVMGETSIDLIRSSHLRQVGIDEKKSRVLSDVLEHKQWYVASCFLGSQTMRSWLVLLLIPNAMAFGENLSNFGLQTGWPTILTAGFLLGIPTIALNVVFGELIPRSYASTNPLSSILRIYGFVVIFSWVFKPIASLTLALGGLITKRFGANASFSVNNQAEEEIKERLEQAVETQEIEEDEKAMLHSVFEFGDTVAREVMTPRVDLDAVPLEASMAEVARVVEETGHSRIPVYEGTDDQIVGIIHAKDVLKWVLNGSHDEPLRNNLRPAHFVPQSKNLHDLLREMRINRSQIVIVQDEFGGTAGIVSIEDIVEEVVGEIVDEYDDDEIKVIRDGSKLMIGGKMNIDDLNEEVGTKFESEEFDTIGGFVFGLFGKQPAPGESIESGGYRFTVEDTDGRRINLIALEKLEDEPISFPMTSDQAI